MKTKYYTGLLLLAAASLSITSCEDFVEIDQPKDQLGSEMIFEDKALVEAALNQNYIQLRDKVILSGNNLGVGSLMGLYADDCTYWLPSNVSENSFFNNTLVAAEPFVQNFWNGGYQIIYNCNRILEGLDKSQAIAETDKKRLAGEALFTRTLVHFYLLQLFGDVPYITGTDYRINKQIAKTTQQQLYANLSADAQLAAELLPETSAYAYNTGVHKMVVQAFRARLELYRGKWLEAAAFADDVMNSGKYGLEQDLDRVFLKESTGTIWQLKSMAEGVNTLDAQNYVFTTVPPPNISLSNSLTASFETGDLRLEHWIKKLEKDGVYYYHSNKYRERQPTPASKEFSILFRLEEMLYIRTEAALQLGDRATALEHWNVLRLRYGLPLYGEVPVNWQEKLLEERRHEFFCETGHRFFDLKRTGSLAEEMLKTKSNWQTFYDKLPIPQTELLLNPNLLPQNEGY